MHTSKYGLYIRGDFLHLQANIVGIQKRGCSSGKPDHIGFQGADSLSPLLVCHSVLQCGIEKIHLMAGFSQYGGN